MKKNLIKSPATGMPNWLNSKFGGRIKINSTKTFAMALMLFAAGSAYAAPTSNDFVTEWTPTGSTITIPTSGGGYNYNIEYKNITTNSAYTTINGVTGSYTISGLTAGDDYEVRISEAVPGSGFPYFYSLGLNAGERADLKEIVQ
ncbi:MAG TPA: fibronectin type III domain-containing protein, partial [Edaphocola sp.]|nr:fibronectin type III domain-containing protein [Edaphocola sp.]